MMEERQSSQMGTNGVVERGNGLARRLSVGEPSKSVLGLPLMRFIPQDVHSVGDYVHGAVAATLAAIADEPTAQIACGTLGAAVVGVSLLTDYRLSLAKWIPIEVHEVIDHAWGVMNLAAPFVLGYRRREPVVSAVQMATGAMAILVSLFTDYRAYRRPMRRAR
jgi:hypothetical protein